MTGSVPTKSELRRLDANDHHDTFLVTTPGGGVDIQANQHIWVRADYEYQMWHNALGGTSTPNGFTIGAQWDFRRSNSR